MVELAQSIHIVPVEEHERKMRRQHSELKEIWDLLDLVKDPEVPVLSLWDLGVLQDVREQADSMVISITPTYSGCPALRSMRDDIVEVLHANGYKNVRIETRLSPAWTTDWLSESARRQLLEYGISAPVKHLDQVICPQCGSSATRLVSEFGSTACKALYRCGDCQEPFDYFKTI